MTEKVIVFCKIPYFYVDMMIYVHTIDQERYRCQILNGVWQSCLVGNGLATLCGWFVVLTCHFGVLRWVLLCV